MPFSSPLVLVLTQCWQNSSVYRDCAEASGRSFLELSQADEAELYAVLCKENTHRNRNQERYAFLVRHRNPEKLDEICRQITQKLASLPCREFTGPFVPPIDKVRGEWIKCFYIKYARDARLAQNKALLVQALETLKGAASVLSDVDPL